MVRAKAAPPYCAVDGNETNNQRLDLLRPDHFTMAQRLMDAIGYHRCPVLLWLMRSGRYLQVASLLLDRT